MQDVIPHSGQPLSGEEAAPARSVTEARDDGPLLRWTCGGTLGLTLFSILLSLSNRYWQINAIYPVYADWKLWLPVAHGLGMLALLWYFGRPETRRGRRCLVTLNGWLICLAALYWRGTLDFVVAASADLLLRATMLGLWCMACAGLPYTVAWIRRHRNCPRPAYPFGKCWFSVLVLLFTAEPLMLLLDHEDEKYIAAAPGPLPEPPDNELRIVSLGSSTMFGHPYNPKFGISQIVAWRVQQMYPQRKVISENLAVPGQDVRRAVLCLGQLKFRPHLVLLYSGHNEFFHQTEEIGFSNESRFRALDGLLNWSPTFRVLNKRLRRNMALKTLKGGLERKFADSPVASPALSEQRRERFQHQLEVLARFGKSQGIAMLWYIPTGSESGYEPNRSCVRRGTPPAEIAALYERYSTAMQLQRERDWSAAAELYRDGLLRQPQFAEFHFRLAECLLKLGRTDEARKHFREALDEDGHPVRLIRPYRETIAKVAAAFSIPIVDAGDALQPHAAYGILGHSLFHDNVHPKLRGFYKLGMAGANVLQTSRLLEPHFGAPRNPPPAQFADAVKDFKVDRSDIAQAYRCIANGLRWLARLRFDTTQRDQQADRYLQLAERLEAGEIEPGEEGTEALH